MYWDLTRSTEISQDIWFLHLPFDIWHLTVVIWNLPFDIWHLTFDICYLTVVIWNLTFDIRDAALRREMATRRERELREEKRAQWMSSLAGPGWARRGNCHTLLWMKEPIIWSLIPCEGVSMLLPLSLISWIKRWYTLLMNCQNWKQVFFAANLLFTL